MTTATKSRLSIVVLAAGRSSRFGATKQLATVEGQTLVGRAVAAATAVVANRTVLVAGHDWRAVSSACDLEGGFLLLNDEYERGLGTSIALAARALQHGADALLYMLADQPFVTPEHLHGLHRRWTGAAEQIVASAYDGTLGPPALFGSGCFEALSALDGDEGARLLFADERFDVARIPFAAAAIDIDTPQDLERL